jgi:arginine N-succinyltransferase
MFVLRPVREADLAAIVALAKSVGGGLTTLPPNAEFLEDRIHESLRAFSPRVRKPGGEHYLFVLEDTATGEVVGTSGIASRVGGFEPFYSYEIRTERYVHRPLKIEKEIATLHLTESHRGPSEVCSLFLRADRRRDGNGRLLSLARFLFIGAFRRRFTDTIIAELRGYIDPTGRSPFWEAVGRPFFDFDFYRADVLSGLGEKEFIADLMPEHPIYVPLLPPEVQAVIGRVHHETEPALALLRAEGFAATNEVDIFDAGPLVRAEVADLRTIRHAQTAKLREIVAGDSNDDARPQLMANSALDFRACLGAVIPRDDGVALAAPLAEALRLRVGDTVTFSPVK